MKLKYAALALSLFAMGANAEAPNTSIGGDIDINIDTGVVLNAGISVGGDAELETSIGSTHGNTDIGGDLNLDVSMRDLFGVSVVNAGASIGGSLCAKTAIGSVGASTCTYD